MTHFTTELAVRNGSFELFLNGLRIAGASNSASYRAELECDTAIRAGFNTLALWWSPNPGKQSPGKDPAPPRSSCTVRLNRVVTDTAGASNREVLGSIEGPTASSDSGGVKTLEFRVPPADLRIRLWSELSSVPVLTPTDLASMGGVLKNFLGFLCAGDVDGAARAGAFRIGERARAKGVPEPELAEVYGQQMRRMSAEGPITAITRSPESLVFIPEGDGRVWMAHAARSQGEPWLGVEAGGKRVFIPVGLGKIEGSWTVVR